MNILDSGPNGTGELVEEIDTAITRGVGYLLSQRDHRGLWSEFRTLAGPSTEWVSAFAAFALARTDRAPALNVARRVWRRLRWTRWWSAGWGYNGTVPCDADSTIWALHLAASWGAKPSRRTLRFLARHITPHGGIATFASEGPIRTFTRLSDISFAGWCGAHACVTAAGAALRELPGRPRALQWLRDTQHPAGHWTSYWWTTPHYATALAAEALLDADGPGDYARVQLAVQWVTDDLVRRAQAMSPFELAFALRTTLLPPSGNTWVAALVGEIVRIQRSDGSWLPSARLRIPLPDVTDPDSSERWVEGGRGGGSVQADRGCFTTAAVLLALRAA